MIGKSFTVVFQYFKHNVFFLFEVLTMELKRISQALLTPVLLSSIVFAPQADAADALAKAVQNPLTSMVTLPLQANYNSGFGPNDRTIFNLNVQPVVPFLGK